MPDTATRRLVRGRNDRPPAPPRPQLRGDGRHQRIRRFQPETRTTECRIQIQNQELRTQELELGLRADMSNFWMAYRNNLDLWSLEKENLVAAQENYRIAIDRYKLGDLSGIELREAQNSLLEAEERQSIAEYSTKICEISLLQLSGKIMDMFHEND